MRESTVSMYARTSDGDFILPMMREAMNTIIADNTHLTERCEAMLAALDGDVTVCADGFAVRGTRLVGGTVNAANDESVENAD